MRKNFVLAAILILGIGPLFLQASPGLFRVFFLGQPAPLHPVILHDTVYVPLSEAASLFHLRADVDLSGNLILLEPETLSPISPAPVSSSKSNNVVLGIVLSPMGEAVEKPLPNIEIRLFKANKRYGESVSQNALESWILQKNDFYTAAHGEVAGSTSDSSGRFAFEDVPPGRYELVAVHALSPLTIGYWRVLLELVKGETVSLTLDSRNIRQLPIR